MSGRETMESSKSAPIWHHCNLYVRPKRSINMAFSVIYKKIWGAKGCTAIFKT